MTTTTALLIGRIVERAARRLELASSREFAAHRAEARRVAQAELSDLGLSAVGFLEAVEILNDATRRPTAVVACPEWAMAFAR